jgi:hypothetical protein
MTDEIMHWRKGSHELYAFGRVLRVSCNVRNEVNGQRHETEIAYSIPEKLPYQPRTFPKGLWSVGMPVQRTSKELAPWFIPTEAWQELPVWDVVEGKYHNATDRKTIDKGYGLHYSEFKTTLGCIKIEIKAELLWLVAEIKSKLASGHKVFLDVHL